jgi:hypothetical protein
MSDPAESIWFPFFSVAWIVLVIAASIAFRRRRGKPIFPKAPAEAIFSERGCSGRSLNTPWARIGGAKNCLLVALTPQELTIVPTFPFNLVFLPEIYGLEHNLGISAIGEVVDRGGLLGRYVTLSYADPKLGRVELRLQHREEFLQCLREIGVSVSIA